MRRATPVPSRLVFVVTLLCTLLTVSSANAALRPGRPPLSNGTPEAVAPGAEIPFVCGTYKGNESEHAWRRDVAARVQRNVKEGRTPVSAALDYVYDDVWIVEDDGSLTFTGNNPFDTPVNTFQFTNDGGGVYTVSAVAFSFDAVLGTSIAPGDDGSVLRTLPFSFPFAGSSWTQVYVGGNGAIAFGAPVNSLYYDPAEFYNSNPKIAPFYLDLDHTSGGTINVKSEATKYTITWNAVREFGTVKANTIQLVLYPSGNWTATYNGIASTIQNNLLEFYAGFHPGGAPSLEAISYSAGLPHVSAAGAAVYEAFYNYANPLVNEVALFQRFYSHFPDEFFQLVFFTNFVQTMGGFANESNISNDVDGIGLGFFDASGPYGSNSVLESRCNMNRLGVWNADPTARVHGKGNNFLTIMGQEAGHRWGAFTYFNSGGGSSNLILGRDDAHWSYYVDVDHSSLEGGNWQFVSGSTYTCPTTIDYYSELDEYLFGLRTPNEVKDFYYISSASNNMYSARAVGTPLMGATAMGTLTPVTVEDVITENGARAPTEPNEEHDLRQGFILLVRNGLPPTQAELDKVALFRRSWEDYFEKSCDGRLACNTSLTTNYDVAVLCGYVYDLVTTEILPEFTARSLERGFNQHVPDDGRYIFRYMENASSGPAEDVTVVFESPGFYPDTLEVSLPYGTTTKVNVSLLRDQATGAGDTPAKTELFANHPNPFNPSTTIRYRLGAAGSVKLSVFDATGAHVRTLVNESEDEGEHTVEFNGRDDSGRGLASGVYFYRLEAGSVVQTRKMVLLK